MSLGAGQKRTSGDTPAPGETGSPEVNCQKCKGQGGVGGEKVRSYLKLKEKTLKNYLLSVFLEIWLTSANWLNKDNIVKVVNKGTSAWEPASCFHPGLSFKSRLDSLTWDAARFGLRDWWAAEHEGEWSQLSCALITHTAESARLRCIVS